MLGFAIPKLPDIPSPPDIPIPTEFPSFIDPFKPKPKPLQFQCEVMSLPVSGTPAPVLQVAMGSVTYTQSLMPFIKTGAFTDHRQAYMNFAAVLSSGVTPVPITDPTSPWMLGGGGYTLTGEGRWFVTLSKWDVSSFTALGPLLNLEMPWVSIVKSGSDEFNALFVDAGPSLYQNTMNIQKMDGYQDVESSGETLLDWGHCHTTYFNPRFLGNHVRIIAVIDSIPATPCEVSVVQLRAGGPTANEIQQIIFVGLYKSGTATFSFGGATTTTSFNPSNQTAYDLQQCLNTIPALSGNVFVQQAAPGVYQVEFTNKLKNTDVETLTPISSLTTFSNWYKVYQCAVGSQDVVIPCELNATFLMNKADVTEAEDPYYLNANSIPPWQNISNIEAARTAGLLPFVAGFATPVINDVLPRAFETVPLIYGQESGCTGDDPMPTLHPFLVTLDSQSGGNSTYSIVSGTVNNLVPNGVGAPITVTTGSYFVYLKLPFVSTTFPANNSDFKWEIAATMPADTDAFGYVKVADINPDGSVSQFVTGSLWADRIKLGALTARYYFSRI